MKKIKAFISTHFKQQSGGIPLALWVLPMIVWLVGGLAYPFLFSSTIIDKTSTASSSVASNLQEDINFMATQTTSSDLFSMSKKELLKVSNNDNFLMRKVKRTLERSDYAKSMGTKDDVPLVFDDQLNPHVNENTTENLAVQTDQPIKSIASLSPDSTQASIDVRQALSKIRAGQSSNYEYLETQRKAKLATAKQENKQRRIALEQSTLEEQVIAYKKGLEDQEHRYAAFNESETQSTKSTSQKSPSNQRNKSRKKVKNPRLQFDTHTGVKDELKFHQPLRSSRASTKSPINKEDTPLVNSYLTKTKNAINPTKNQPLYATIDRTQKLQSGDKLRLRITQSGNYNGYLIPVNQIVYGICSIGKGRIKVNVSSITLNHQVIRATLEAYDLDGMSGIYMEGADINIGKQAIQEGLREAGNLAIRNPLGNLSLKLGKKASKVSKARIPSGYQVLLYDKTL